MRKTKIICTMGPSTDKEGILFWKIFKIFYRNLLVQCHAPVIK